MSHFVRVKSAIKSKSSLLRALKRLSWQYKEGDFNIQLYGQNEKAQISLGSENGACTLGLSEQKDGTWAIVGDPYHTKGKMREYYGNNKGMMKELQTAYAVEDVTSKLEDLNMYCTENTEAKVGSDGKIRMVFAGGY